MNIIVAIDGPAGSGKGTVSKIVSEECDLTYIDTGAMYRSIAYLAIKNNVKIEENNKIIELARNARIEFIDGRVLVNDEDVTSIIRSMEVSKIVSPVSSIVEVRNILVDMQRAMADKKSVIMEGRDITTVVFPNATYKFYLDATLEERARRRYKENLEKGIKTDYQEVLENIKKRDYNDMHKEIGSLIRTDDQIYIDSTKMTIREVVDKIKGIIKKK